MAYIKEKNIIKYTGRNYEFIFNKLASCSRANINPFIEKIMVAAPKLWNIISQTDGLFMRDINKLITLAKKNWKYVLQLEKSTDGNPYEIDGYITYQTAIYKIKIASLGLNELEAKWYKDYHNIPFGQKVCRSTRNV